MSEKLTTRSPEQIEAKEIPEVAKSQEFYTGDINEAVIDAQKTTGYNIDEDWWKSEVGNDGTSEEILDRFDKAYERTVWRAKKVPEEEIVTLQSHDDHNANTEQRAEQVNGINIPPEVARNEDIKAEIWAEEERKRREQYIFSKAEWHLNREFTIGDKSYKIDGIYYTGTDGDYLTEAIDVLDIKTGALTHLTVPELEAAIKAEQPNTKMIQTEAAATGDDVAELTEKAEKPAETEESAEQQNLTARINKELENFDENAALERAQFEAFLYGHPELLEDEAAEVSHTPQPTPTPTTPTPTINAIKDVEPLTDDEIRQKGIAAIKEFDDFVIGHPELKELRGVFIEDLEAHLNELRDGELVA